MTTDTHIKYLGWSSVIVSSGGMQLCFDPCFTKIAGAKWSSLEDYEDVKIICLTHGHSEHYLDAHKVAKKTGAILVAPKVLCDRLVSQFNVDTKNLVAVNPHETVEIANFNITAFDWYHRSINYLKFFGGDFVTGLKFSLTNLIKCHNKGPYFGYHIGSTEGLNLLNFSEGISANFPTDEAEELGKKYPSSIMLAGAQLDYEDDMARIVKAVSPKELIMYHPHEKLFERMNINSSPRYIFADKVKSFVPEVEIIPPNTDVTAVLGS